MGYFYWTSPLSQCHYGFVEYHPHPREHQASPSLGCHPYSDEQEESPSSVEFARMGTRRISPIWLSQMIGNVNIIE